MNFTAWIGLAVIVGSETATLARIEPFWSWNTPIAWTGFILFADGIVWHTRRNSWIRSNGREFVFLALASIPLWLVFEGYNRIIRNWYYTGLPENIALRMFGYAWSFATIWPAIFEGAELVAVLRAGDAGKRAYVVSGFLVPPKPRRGEGGSRTGFLPDRSAERAKAVRRTVAAAGALMLVSPFLVPATVAPYMAAPVWLGFIFLLDPLNAGLGGESILADLRAGRRDRMINLALSGLLCGVLWEFWNYWARAKWHYTVPIMENLRVFEMPVPGYLGSPAFALECFTMYVFVRAIYVGLAKVVVRTEPAGTELGRTIAL
jgi:hypothetical protein